MSAKEKELLFKDYSRRFADRVSSEYFARNSRVTSSDVLEVQSIRQVNLFVIKTLYDQWQRETAKLKSSFFDYSNPEVKKALQSYMNTLSHHISLDRFTYAELLQKAVSESLNLIFHPFDYYHSILAERGKEGVPVSYLKYISKYIKTNNHILQHMLEVMAQENLEVLSEDKIMWLLDESLARTNEAPADVEPFLNEFSEIVPLKMEDVYGGEDTPTYTPPQAESEEEDDLDDEDDPIELGEDKFDYEKAEEKRRENSRSSSDDNEHEPPGDTDSAEAEEQEVPNVQIRMSDDTKKGRNLAEALANRVDYSFDTPEKSMLNDILSHEQRETLADKHQNARITNLRKHLNINQRFMFINSLFQGDEQAFDRTLEHLESIESADEALSFLTHKFSQWEDSSEEVQEFLQLVQRRYPS
jgi:hypothetical protein